MKFEVLLGIAELRLSLDKDRKEDINFGTTSIDIYICENYESRWRILSLVDIVGKLWLVKDTREKNLVGR